MKDRSVRFGVIGLGLMGREFASAASRWCHLLEDIPQPLARDRRFVQEGQVVFRVVDQAVQQAIAARDLFENALERREGSLDALECRAGAPPLRDGQRPLAPRAPAQPRSVRGAERVSIMVV